MEVAGLTMVVVIIRPPRVMLIQIFGIGTTRSVSLNCYVKTSGSGLKALNLPDNSVELC